MYVQYIPKAEDSVLGVVEDRGAEQYRVNIFGRWVRPEGLTIVTFHSHIYSCVS